MMDDKDLNNVALTPVTNAKFTESRLGIICNSLQCEKGDNGKVLISVRQFNSHGFSLENYDMAILFAWWSAYGKIQNLVTVDSETLDPLAQTMDSKRALYEPFFIALGKSAASLGDVSVMLSHKPGAIDFEALDKYCMCYQKQDNPKLIGIKDINGVLTMNYAFTKGMESSRLSMWGMGISAIGFGLSVLSGVAFCVVLFGVGLIGSSALFLYSNRSLTIKITGDEGKSEISVNR